MKEELKVEITATLNQFSRQLKQASDKFDNATDKMSRQSKRSSRQTQKAWGGSLKRIGSLVAGAFAVERVIDFGREAVDLAGRLEGVERAFKRIGDPQLLQSLRSATRETVSDLELMQQAVRASNFKIPLNQLASLFEFATARANETGESVDFLVNSIISGIGRKSPLILDNLGISAVELRKRLKGVGVEAANVGDIAAIIGDIATEEMDKMGESAQTSGQKTAALAAETENLKAQIGEKLVPVMHDALGTFNNILEAIDDITSAFGDNSRASKRWAKSMGLAVDEVARKFDETDLMKAQNEINQQALNVFGRQLSDAANQTEKLSDNLVAWFYVMGIGAPKVEETTEKTKELTDAMINQAAAAKIIQQENRKVIDSMSRGVQTAGGDADIGFDSFTEQDEQELRRANEASQQFLKNTDKLNAKLAETRQITGSIAMSISQGFANAIEKAVDGTQSLGDALGQFFREFLRQIAVAIGRALIFAAIMSAFGMGSFTGLFKQGLGFSGGGGVQRNASGFSARPFADGGVISGPTLGLMGEYSGARTNPEVVAPLDRLKGMIGNMGGTLSTKISGRDLLLVLEKERRVNTRQTGRG